MKQKRRKPKLKLTEIPWRKKMTVHQKQKFAEDKAQQRKRDNDVKTVQRQTQENSREIQFNNDCEIVEYCKNRGLSSSVVERIQHDQKHAEGDYRHVVYENRLPSSYRCNLTPPGYWGILSPLTPVTQ